MPKSKPEPRVRRRTKVERLERLEIALANVLVYAKIAEKNPRVLLESFNELDPVISNTRSNLERAISFYEIAHPPKKEVKKPELDLSSLENPEEPTEKRFNVERFIKAMLIFRGVVRQLLEGDRKAMRNTLRNKLKHIDPRATLRHLNELETSLIRIQNVGIEHVVKSDLTDDTDWMDNDDDLAINSQ